MIGKRTDCFNLSRYEKRASITMKSKGRNERKVPLKSERSILGRKITHARQMNEGTPKNWNALLDFSGYTFRLLCF